MHVFPLAPQHEAQDNVPQGSATGSSDSQRIAERSYLKESFLERLRGSPRMENLLTCLSKATVDATIRKTLSGRITSPNTERERSCADVNVQEAFLNELCRYVALGEGPQKAVEALKASRALPLRLPTNASRQDLSEFFAHMAKTPYWRKALLYPLLRRWWKEGSYTIGSTLLLDALMDELLKQLDSSNNSVNKGPSPDDVSCESEQPGLLDVTDGLVAELEELIGATESFGPICTVIDIIVQNCTRRLAGGVYRIVENLSTGNEEPPTYEEAHQEMECVVNDAASFVWEEISALFTRCSISMETTFNEMLWTFLMALITSYSGAHVLATVDASRDSVDRVDNLQLWAQGMFYEKLQRDLQDHLAVRLSSDGGDSGKAFMSVQNVTCHQTFFWRCTMEAGLAHELLLPEFLAHTSIKEWARERAAETWGRALRVIQCFLHVQEAVEEMPDTVVPTIAESVISSVRAYHRRLTEEHLEHLSSAQKTLFSVTKRPRAEEIDRQLVEREADWLSYTVDFFLCTYHPSCFVVLSMVKQDEFISLLRQLHGILVYKEREAVRDSLMATAPNQAVYADVQNQLMQWHKHCVHDRLLMALGNDASLIMCLLHGTFALFSRMGKTNVSVHEIFREMLLPSLSILCGSRSKVSDSRESDDNEFSNLDEDVEEYYERQQCMGSLIAAGFLSIPWNLRGIRLRLLLLRSLSTNLRDCFSAEEALAELDDFFVRHFNGRQTPEETALEVCTDCARDPFLMLLDTEGDTVLSGTEIDAMEDVMFVDITVHLPAPGGTMFMISVFRTLSQELLRLRTEWEQHVRLADEGEESYLDRRATFCTAKDIVVFRTLVKLVHHMVFAFQVQPLGLLRLWISFLVHLFLCVVPPLTEDDELILLAPHVQEQKFKKEGEKEEKAHGSLGGASRTAFGRAPNESPQGELRAVLGELLAELMLMPFLDESVAKQCPAAVEYTVNSTRWLRQQRRRDDDIRILQRIMPLLVLEEVCFALKINVSAICSTGTEKAVALKHAGRMVEHSFLGALGVFAFCQQLDRFITPNSITDERVSLHMEALWGALEATFAPSTL
uniref:WGS project CAEQ00000000 data, annotated contig 729 n=1 Tax=Trypanosoma congolense (strain IL3000) TaxID=1068625 RepID=F9WI41_TRYCI|nr:unnamed protein product [Trypanosoma congolense IL3000]